MGGRAGDWVTTEEQDDAETARTRAASSGPFRVRLQVVSAGEGALGPGKAALLEAIGAEGSISAAGRALGISYRRCWLLVDEMNRCWDKPLVEARRGGRDQGAQVSALGAEILLAYRALEARLMAEVRAAPETKVLLGRLLATPRAAASSRIGDTAD